MKKLIPIAILILFSNSLFAQVINTQPPPPIPPKKAKFKGGVMINPFIGWTPANVDDPTKNSITSKGAQFGFAYGLLGEFFFNNNYGISTNLRVSGFNTEFNYTPQTNNSVISIDRTLHQQYIEIPVTLKMRTNEVGYMKYFAQFGFMPSVQLGTKLDVDTTYKNGNVSSEVKGLNATSNVNLFMLYSVIGIGAEYNLGGTTSMVFSITWNNGFTNIWHKQTDNTSSNPPILSNFNTPEENIALNIGVLF